MFDCSKIRGFNYQPSRGTTSLENWVYYNPELAELELRRGKEYFPGFNTVRYWLSWDAYYRDPKGFKAKFEQSLIIADRLGLKVIVCLLNRWHDDTGYDNGGVYLDNILFPSSWCYYRPQYQAYVDDISKTYSRDPRILTWDICNEPFSYHRPEDEKTMSLIVQLIAQELEWLTELYQVIKKNDNTTPVGVSLHPGLKRAGLERINAISDILLIHPYFICNKDNFCDEKLRMDFEADVQINVEYAKEVNKQLLVTETCWGAYTDDVRVEIIKYTLGTLSKYNIGFVAHALHYSRVADLHYEEDGYVGTPGNLAFINKDGTLRAGHDIFNQY